MLFLRFIYLDDLTVFYLIKSESSINFEFLLEHSYCAKETGNCKRIIKFNPRARHDGLEKIEVESEHMVENYVDREDLFVNPQQ